MTQIVVVRPPPAGSVITCGGQPMVDAREAATPAGGSVVKADGGTMVGKRYVDEEGTFEVICTRPGEGLLAVDERPLRVKDPKPLPASD